MKPHIRNKGPFLSTRPCGASTGRVLASIRNITSELEDLQAEIYSQMGGPVEMLQRLSQRERESAERALSDFKVVLDQLRYVLWLSGEPASHELPKTDVPARVETTRSPQPTSNARSAPQRHKSSDEAPTTASFFDRLDVVIEAYMKKNETAGNAPRKRPKT